MSESLFDPVAFARELRVTAAFHSISQADIARHTGASRATISRICSGKAPDVENYLRLSRWMEDNKP